MDASRYSTCGRGETEPQTQPRASGSAPTFDVYPPIGALTDVELVNTGVLETFARSQSCGSLDSSSSLVAQFLTAATGARTSVAKPNSSCQSTEIEQTFQSSNLDPWFRDPPNSLEPALTAVSHFPPQQLRQPQHEQQQEQPPISNDRPDTLAFQPKATSLFAAQPLHAMRLETQSTSFPTSRSPAPDLATASANIDPSTLLAAPSHSPHSSGPPEYGTDSLVFPAALLQPYHASLLANIARRHRFHHGPTTLGGVHCSNPGPSGRSTDPSVPPNPPPERPLVDMPYRTPNWTFRSLHASPSTFSMTTDTAQPHPNQFMAGFACGDGSETGLENNGNPTVSPNAEEDDKMMKMGHPGTEKKKGNPQSKRMRVVQSCSECRRRKIKCNKK
jgi:hypothetical protein